MAPRAPTIFSIMSSTTYPPVPSIDELEQLKHALEAQQAAATTRLSSMQPTAEEERKIKKDKKRKDREATDDRERAALAANQRAGAALEVVERRRVDATGDVKVKNERVSPAPSNASSASFRPNSQQQTYGNMLKKKKMKRVVDSDDEGTSHHTPPPQSTSGLKLKLAPGKSRPQSQVADPSPAPSSSAASTGPGSNIDWSLPPPPQRPLVPPRPGVQKPLKPGPKRQAEVNVDYSDHKAPSQIAVQTFWQNVEPYIRDLREDDLAMLNFKADQPDLFTIPPRGRHYTEIWDEEDGNPPGTTSRFPVPSQRPPPKGPLPHCIATEIRDPNLVEENRGLGAITERLVAAVIGGEDIARANKEAAAGKPEPDGEASREAARIDVVDLEERVKKEMRSVMLLGDHEEFDRANRDDDEVTCALRQCQKLLQQQITVNDARKARLAKIAQDRLAYGEYQSTLDQLEKDIEAAWAKRIKKHGGGGKKVLQDGVVTGQGRPPVPELLKTKLKTREQWMERVGKTLLSRPEGEVVGLPTKSIYEGIPDVDGKEDKQAADDAMEVDEADAEEVDGMAV